MTYRDLHYTYYKLTRKSHFFEENYFKSTLRQILVVANKYSNLPKGQVVIESDKVKPFLSSSFLPSSR